MSSRKIVLGASRDIPFNKFILSQANVRRVKAGISLEDLAEDIARRGILQSLNVRPVLDDEGAETGMFEVPAGGRRFRALELLVKQKRLVKSTPVPCVVKSASDVITAEEDSLAENVQRAALHPLDQFRAFQALREKGLNEEEIAARFFVSPTVVKQRLKLAAVSPKLLDAYVEEAMDLEQLMAFAITADHARQEAVWETISKSYNHQPYYIRRVLTEGAVRASDKRAQFVGIDAYEAAGGVVSRDLFEEDNGGWLQDAALLERLATEKLKHEAETIAAEGWKWINAAIDFPYGHTNGLRRISGQAAELSEEEGATYDALRAEYDRIESEYAESDDLPDEVDQRLAEIEIALGAFDDRPIAYDPADIARAGVFLSIDSEGGLRVERGYLRPEDEVREPVAVGDDAASPISDGEVACNDLAKTITVAGQPESNTAEEEDNCIRPLSDRVVAELTAQRTLSLRDAIANRPDIALLAVLHVLCLNAFYRFASDNSCLQITATSAGLTAQAPGLNDSASARAIETRHEAWAKRLPSDAERLWDALIDLNPAQHQKLLAHCASLSLNVVRDPYQRRSAAALAHGDVLARAVGLYMPAVWKPTVDNYLGRVSKARILEAVREAKGEAAAQLIDHLKKPEMAAEAERLLADTDWVPEPLRTLGGPAAETSASEWAGALPAFLADAADIPEASESETVIVN
jgi:ParB family chromosome partitioning protein